MLNLGFALLLFCSSVLTPFAYKLSLFDPSFFAFFSFVAKAVLFWVSAHCNLNVKKSESRQLNSLPAIVRCPIVLISSGFDGSSIPCRCSLLVYTFYLLIS